MFANFFKTDKTTIERKFSQFSTECKCPYCGTRLEKEVINKFKCTSCKQIVFVKKVNDKRYFLTEEENIEMINVKEFESVKNRYFNTLVNNGYDQNKLEKDFDKHNILNIDALRDFIFTSYNHLISVNSKNAQAQSLIYFAMANFCSIEKQGINVYGIQKLAFDLQLKSYSEGAELLNYNCDVRIYSYSDRKECSNDHGRIVPYLDMVKNPILPHLGTDPNFLCSCTYSLVARSDENGIFTFNE